MILFLGDSFTWGQGLQIPYWIERGYSIDEINDLMPPAVALENVMDYNADEYRKKHHFPNLVAKHFNKPYSTKWGNGGNNSDCIFLLKNLFRNISNTQGIEFVVIQFTDSQRDIDLQGYVDSGQNPDIVLKTHCEQTVKNLDDVCKMLNTKWFGFSWFDDIGTVLEKNYKDNYIPIIYKGKKYNCFEILRHQCELNFDCTINEKIHDSHINYLGHEIIADSIIKKLTDFNIKIVEKKIPTNLI